MAKYHDGQTRIVFWSDGTWRIERYIGVSGVWRVLAPAFTSRDKARSARRAGMELVALLDEQMTAAAPMPAVNTEGVE